VVYVVAILATLVASQATITATFSLFQQVINLRSLPPVRMRYTSNTVQGQIYIPSVNWILCVGTIIFVLIFKDLAKLTNAYGFAVATVMIVTTTLITIQIPYVKHLPWVVAIAWFLFFGFLDGLFWGAALRKIPHGAWVPLLVGVVATGFMVFWTWAQGLEDHFDGANRRNLRHFISKEVIETVSHSPITRRNRTLPYNADLDVTVHEVQEEEVKSGMIPHIQEDTKLYLDIGDEKVPLSRMSTMAIFHKLSSGKGVPHTFYGFLKQWPALPRVVIFLSVRIMPIAHVEKEDQYRVTKVRSLPGFYGATYMKGYRDKFNVDIAALVELITVLELRSVDSKEDAAPVVEEIISASKNATHMKTYELYISRVPHYHVIARRIIVFGAPIVNWIRKLLIEDVYRSIGQSLGVEGASSRDSDILTLIAYVFPETVTWLQSADEIIHVGVTAEI
ncbi:hypothetical protein FRC17_001875, partial [Serendipita sp. 399]